MDCTMYSYEHGEVYFTKSDEYPLDRYCWIRFKSEDGGGISIMFNTKPKSLIAYHQLCYAVEELGKYLYRVKE